ncbi:MAG: 2-oxoadipate dioxygenase/decarboxylase family protein, partial [Pseudobdellovibrio sp.]
IKSLAQHFTKYGYKDAGEYFFKEKKLYAKHFQHADESYPKIFISELELEKVSPFVRETLNHCIEQIKDAAIQNENFVFSGKHWATNHATYEKLAAESEYASWVYAYGFRPNHFTVNINVLKKWSDIHVLNNFLKQNNFKLNASGGEIKGTPEELLEQSSTMAAEIPVQFSDGTYNIPGCYYEFAKRYPMTNGQLYHGFIAKSADKIFESTNKAK